MSQRAAALIALFGFAVLVIGAWLTGGNLGLADSKPARISFQIATGSTEGIYFPVGQAIAGLISHPSGVGRCETATVCGPAGVILSARTSEGAADNLRIVSQGQVDSGLAQGNVIAAAVAGRDIFRRPVRHLAVIAALFPEEAHLLAADQSRIHTVADLRGKRVALGEEGSGAAVTGRAILSAYGLAGRVRIVPAGGESGAQLLQEGKADAWFTVSGVPLDPVKDLLARHQARLIPIDGEGRDRLVRKTPQLKPAVIAAGAYPGAGAVETVSTRAFWVTRDSEPDALIYGITRSLFNPVNHAPLAASHASAREIALDHAAEDAPAPIHPGAARFYREVGKLPE
ncbi:MAG TPA: TAXI family TRAP transporter solute-binding subunit [Rhizomicrobium sp.]|jgi:TRAP transporter TAXI family solute receptor|nr:TAXI family TRAP transporter solute-binding subunit [Rhizomicrobium sp.]